MTTSISVHDVDLTPSTEKPHMGRTEKDRGRRSIEQLITAAANCVHGFSTRHGAIEFYEVWPGDRQDALLDVTRGCERLRHDPFGHY